MGFKNRDVAKEAMNGLQEVLDNYKRTPELVSLSKYTMQILNETTVRFEARTRTPTGLLVS